MKNLALKNITRSGNESDLYDLEVFRGAEYFDTLPGQSLKEDIYLGKPDVVKIKVNTEDVALFSKLDQLNFPYSIQSLIFKNSVPVEPEDGNVITPTHISYKRAALSDSDVVERIVRNTLQKPTSSIHHSNYQYFQPDRYEDNTVAYLRSFIDSSDKEVWLLLDKEEPVGYFSGIFHKDYFEGILYGILPEHRRKGYSNWVYQIMKSICAKSKMITFVNDVQVQNFGSVVSAGKIGMISNLYYHLNLYPMLSDKSDSLNKGESRFDNFDAVSRIFGESDIELPSKAKIFYNLPDKDKMYQYSTGERTFLNGFKVRVIKIIDDEKIKGHVLLEEFSSFS